MVVASGPTREWIDPVRFISNPSSGATGWQIARAGLEFFQEVHFVSGPAEAGYGSVEGATNHAIETTTEMRDRVLECLRDRTLLVMAAAPADFTPAAPSESKIKKEGLESVTLELTRAPDVLLAVDAVAESYAGLYRVGFAAETDNVIENAADKLKRKRLDFICANRVFQSRLGFGANKNTLAILDAAGEQYHLGPSEKDRLARDLLAFLIERLGSE